MSQIVMPQAGQSMEEGTIVRWHKAEGDAVAKGEVLFEIETDKSVIEVEASEAGVLARILVGEGKTVPVKTPVAELEKPGEKNAECGMRNAECSEQSAISNQQTEIGRRADEDVRAPSESAIRNPQSAMVKPVLMPQAGQSMEEGTLVKWRVAPGAAVRRGDVIFEVETDKSVVEVEATEDGRLARIVAPEGAVVPVLQPVAYLAERDEDVDAYLAAAPSSTASIASIASTPSMPSTPSMNEAGADEGVRAPSGRMKVSPAARKLARERGVELEKLGQGSGPGGRIVTGDVARAGANVRAEARTPNEARAEARTPNARRAGEDARAPGESAIEPYHPVQPKSGQTVRTKMSPMRRAIARNLLASKQTIPHWYLERAIDADPLMAFYRARKAQVPCSVNDVIVLAVSRAIMEFPEFRCRVEGEEIVEFPSVNIGIAVGLEAGLVVPVVVGVERMNLAQLGAESRRLAEQARSSGKVENMGKGVFTVSNLGMFGVDRFTAIINPPEAAILAVAAVREEVIVRNGMMRPGRTMSLTLSADHRLIDGLLGAKFMARLKEMLEHPEALLI